MGDKYFIGDREEPKEATCTNQYCSLKRLLDFIMMLFKCTRLMSFPRNGQCARFVSIASSSSMVEKSIASSLHHATNTTTLNANSTRMTNTSFHGNSNHQQRQNMEFSTSTRRRRRRGGGGGIPVNPVEEDDASNDNNSTGHSAAALSSEKFLSVANGLLDKVESAVTKLKDCNDGLEITRYPPCTTDYTSSTDEDQRHGGRLSIHVDSSGDLYWGGGTYWLTILPDDNTDNGSGGCVSLQSPLSGSFAYVYNSSTGEWVGNEDGHSLLGMLTRDWIRQCRGVPDF